MQRKQQFDRVQRTSAEHTESLPPSPQQENKVERFHPHKVTVAALIYLLRRPKGDREAIDRLKISDARPWLSLSRSASIETRKCWWKGFGASSDCLLRMLICFNWILRLSSSFHFLPRDLLYFHFPASPRRPFAVHASDEFRFLQSLIKSH